MIGEILSLILPLNPDENRRKPETSAGFGRYFDIDTRKVAVVVKIEIRGIYIAANQQFFFLRLKEKCAPQKIGAHKKRIDNIASIIRTIPSVRESHPFSAIEAVADYNCR